MTAIEQCSLIPRTNVANTLRIPRVRTVLNRLFAAAAQDDEVPRWQTPGVSEDLNLRPPGLEPSRFTSYLIGLESLSDFNES